MPSILGKAKYIRQQMDRIFPEDAGFCSGVMETAGRKEWY
jgi:hypothetical protein